MIKVLLTVLKLAAAFFVSYAVASVGFMIVLVYAHRRYIHEGGIK